jgi:hypothetical protein
MQPEGHPQRVPVTDNLMVQHYRPRRHHIATTEAPDYKITGVHLDQFQSVLLYLKFAISALPCIFFVRFIPCVK